MPFKILYVVATSAEADVLRKSGSLTPADGGFRSGSLEISVLVAGVGSISTAWAVQKWLSANERPGLAINAGIAGSYNTEYPVGEVVMPVSDCFADAGIEDGNRFLTLSESGLSGPDEFPFSKGLILSDPLYRERMKNILKPVKAISVNTVTGSEITRNRLIKKFNPDIETMEGATFFYICSRERIPFLAVRAISNMVELRNKKNWNISRALDNLSDKLNEVFLSLK